MNKISIELLQKFEQRKKSAPKQLNNNGVVTKRKAGRPAKPDSVRDIYKIDRYLLKRLIEKANQKHLTKSGAICQAIEAWLKQ